MLYMAVITMLLALAVVPLPESAHAQMDKSGKYTGKFMASDNPLKVREVDKEHVFLLSEALGVFWNDAGKGFLHGTSVVCPVFGVIKGGNFTGNGACVVTDKDGDKAFLDWNCTGINGRCEGPFRWTGGTGKYQGLKGDNWIKSLGFIPGTSQEIVDWKGEWQLP